jgi:hypothetical protein
MGDWLRDGDVADTSGESLIPLKGNPNEEVH